MHKTNGTHKGARVIYGRTQSDCFRDTPGPRGNVHNQIHSIEQIPHISLHTLATYLLDRALARCAQTEHTKPWADPLRGAPEWTKRHHKHKAAMQQPSRVHRRRRAHHNQRKRDE